MKGLRAEAQVVVRFKVNAVGVVVAGVSEVEVAANVVGCSRRLRLSWRYVCLLPVASVCAAVCVAVRGVAAFCRCLLRVAADW